MPEWTVGWATDAWLGYDICEAGRGYKRIEANHVYISIYIARYSVGETSRLSSQLAERPALVTCICTAYQVTLERACRR